MPPFVPAFLSPRPVRTSATSARRWVVRSVALGLACYAGGRLGLAFPQAGASFPLIWLPLGVALAGLLRGGPWLWPGPLVAFFLLNLGSGAAPSLAVAAAGGTTLGALLGAFWLVRLDFSSRLQRPRDVFLLLAGGALAATVSELNGAFWHGFGGTLAWSGLPAAAFGGWLSAMVGVPLGAVPMLTLARGPSAHALVGHRRVGDAALAAAALVAGALVLVPQGSVPALGAVAFLVPALLCALAVRAGLGPASAVALLIAAAAAAATSHGLGPFQSDEPTGTLALLWGSFAGLSALVLTAAASTAELARRQERWQIALEGTHLGVADWDLRTGHGFTSARWRALLDDPAAGSAPAAWLARVHDDEQPRLREAFDSLTRPGAESFRHELRLSTRQGWRWFECHALVAERGAQGEPVRVVMSMADISERRSAEERQRLSASLFQHLHEGLLITDAELRVLDFNPTYSQITGLSRQDLIGRVPALLQPAPADTAARAQQAAMWASLRAAGTWRGEMIDRRRNGDPCALQVTISAIRGPDDEPRYHVLVISDITEQRLQRDRLERQAHFDELTRLPNRTRMLQMLGDAMAAAEREGYLLAVCYLDLDHFKPVNDRFGHAAGDRLLVELAQRLRGALRSNANWSDAAARLGGDEFVLLLRAGSLDEARLAVERVLRVISQPYTIDAAAEPVQVTASVGATVYPLDRRDADTLLRHADQAMYGAKQSGRNGYLFFDPEHSRRTEERVMAIGRVQEALDTGEFMLHYQPKVDMRHGVVLGVEALLRWNHPQHGVIAPLRFLPLIEHTGLSARVGDWVLEQALDQLAHWQRLGLDLSVSVNVSARHLQEPDFAQRLAELLARHSRPLGSRLELEVLETAALADVAYTSALLERCRGLGVRFSLDDFGTGYSTLTYLKRLPVDLLKIDRSFVHNMLDDRQDLAIVEGVIGLARTFGCTVVAEGVETPAQARLLIEMGCDVGQGQGIASPMPATDVYRWVREYRGPFSISAAPAPRVDDARAAALGVTPERT